MEVPGLTLPGLGLSSPHDVVAALTRDLKPGDEWRFEVAFGSSLEVKIIQGTAEIFGTELAKNQTYTFTGYKAAIYTTTGCRLELSGPLPSVEYTAEETEMTTYLNLHLALERLRGEAAERRQSGPRVLIIGPENAGKTSLTKILTGYGVRMGRRPMVVNLDPREGVMSVPGTLTATSFSTMIDVEEGFGSSPASGPSPVPVKTPLVYFYGLESPEKNTKYYKPIVSRLALAVNSRLAEDDETRKTGLIIDTASSTNAPTNYEVIQHIISEFFVNVLVVLGSERLYSDMSRRYASASGGPAAVTVLKVAKSGGCVDRDTQFLHNVQTRAIRTYFFGDTKRTLSPYTVLVEFDAVTVYKVIDPTLQNLNMSALPIGWEEEEGNEKPILDKLGEMTSGLENSVVAVMHAEPDWPLSNIQTASVMGFLHMAGVDEKNRRFKLLSPVPGRIPGKAMVVGRYPEATFLS